ncbi:alpha-amylase [Mycobacterium hodleri]|uniref:Alpha-amylase n=2 Tax=Mycolicibacterium hodleri TaxID=49897 RepID=A0A502EF19_9MYCO|nr:alpha-amylase [Mycolicibacterium hodleri]
MSDQPPRRPTPTRWASARHPFIYEINTWPWVTGLSASAGTPVDLSTVPDEHWDAIADFGFDAVWLMGVWQRSPAGAAVALANRDLVAECLAALPDWTPQDVVGSPFCIRNYEVDEYLGGRAGLAAARSALAGRGLALILDFVPNHVAPDHPWTSKHPEYFVSGTSAELVADPESFMDVNGTVLANGRDPNFPAWSDVLQLNAFSRGLRHEIADTLRDVASQCDGVRCDMAMLVMNDVFARTWGDRVGDPPEGEYWPEAIDAVRQDHPDFRFIAESYWDREWPLQQQGFDFCYDKGLYDRLVTGDAAAVRDHLRADADFQSRLLRFVENHDESRAAAILDPARQEAVTLATLTQTGARLVHHGQLTGARVRLPVFLGRHPREDIDHELASFHRALLKALCDSTFRAGTWMLCETVELVSWCWDGDHRWLIVVNLSAEHVADHVRVPWNDVTDGVHRLVDPITGVEWVRSGREVRDGLYVELGPWQWHLFKVARTDPHP